MIISNLLILRLLSTRKIQQLPFANVSVNPFEYNSNAMLYVTTMTTTTGWIVYSEYCACFATINKVRGFGFRIREDGIYLKFNLRKRTLFYYTQWLSVRAFVLHFKAILWWNSDYHMKKKIIKKNLNDN